MSLVEVLLSDPQRSLRGQVAPLFAQALVAALSAKPSTLAELDLALGRFVSRTGERSLLEDFYPIVLDRPDDGASETPPDADPGLATVTRLPANMVPEAGLLIDLPGRVVVSHHAGFRAEPDGPVQYVDDNAEREVVSRYCLGPTWTALPDGFAADDLREAGGVAGAWKRLVAQQRKVRSSLLRIDDQAVLYDRLPEFLAEALLSDRFRECDDPIRDIHAEWLLTPRADLFGACPRDVLIGRLEEVDNEISVREWEWTALKRCPAPLPADSEAVRESGHGSKEMTIYYGLIRHLLEEAWARLDNRSQFTLASLADRIREWRDEWLDRPGYEDVKNCTARWVIEQERRRIPWLIEEHDQFHDPNCPICRWSRENCSPGFHQLVSCHEAEGFAFSLCDSPAEWELMNGDDSDFSEIPTKGHDSGPGIPDVPQHGRMSRTVVLDEEDIPQVTAGSMAGEAPPALSGTKRPMVPGLASMEPAQQVTAWHLRLVLLLIDIRDQAGQGPDREAAEQSLRRLHRFRDAVREDEAWLAQQHLTEVSEQVEALGARRLDLAAMCIEFEEELEQMRRACRAAMSR